MSMDQRWGVAVEPGVSVRGAESVDIPAIYRSHWRQMVRLAVLLVDDVALAEDVTQDGFVALHRNQERLRHPQAAVSYLRANVVNLARSTLRRRALARRHLTVGERDEAPAADTAVHLAAEHAEVLAMLRRLPQRQREVLVLRYWGGVSEAEIADTLGISTGTVKSSASRGIASLRTALEGVR